MKRSRIQTSILDRFLVDFRTIFGAKIASKSMKIAVTRGFENEIDIKSDFSTIGRPGTVWRRNGAGLFVKEHSTQLLHSKPTQNQSPIFRTRSRNTKMLKRQYAFEVKSDTPWAPEGPERI